MDFKGLIFLLVAHYFCGSGLLRLLRVDLKPVPAFCWSMIAGVPLVSLAPCFLQLLGFPIDTTPIIVSIAIMAVLFSVPVMFRFKRPQMGAIKWPSFFELPF